MSKMLGRHILESESELHLHNFLDFWSNPFGNIMTTYRTNFRLDSTTDIHLEE